MTLIEVRISGGDWLLVRSTITTGAHRAMCQVMRHAGTRLANPIRVAGARVLAYLVDWSLVDAAGQRVPYRDRSDAERVAALASLDVDSFVEIADAIAAHEDQQAARRAVEQSEWHAAVSTDLAIARVFGWRYEWVAELEHDVYEVLVDVLSREQRQRD